MKSFLKFATLALVLSVPAIGFAGAARKAQDLPFWRAFSSEHVDGGFEAKISS